MKPASTSCLGDLDLAPEALVEADLENDPRLVAGIDHPPARGDIDRERLLAEHMLAAWRRRR